MDMNITFHVDLGVDLANLCKEVEDKDKALFLLTSLPTSYQGWKQVLLYRNRKSLTYKDVVS